MAGTPMYTAWHGPPTTDPEILRKRRAFLVVLVLLFGGLVALALWWRGWNALPLVLAILVCITVVFGVLEAIVQARARRKGR